MMATTQAATGPEDQLTELLVVWRDGDPQALARLMPLVYDQLRRLAQSYLKHERQDPTPQAAALVHEVYLRLVDKRRPRWRDLEHFFAVAALIMRRILVDRARRRGRLRHGGDSVRVTLDPDLVRVDPTAIDGLALDQALRRLAVLNARQARLIELRFRAGLTLEETAEVLGVGTATVVREWRQARAWLCRELRGRTANGQDETRA